MSRVAEVLAVLLAVLPMIGASSVAAAVNALYPDLKTLPPRELKLDFGVSIDSSGAAHNLLRFSNTVYNAGQGPLILNAIIDPVTRSGPATQRVMNDDGSFTDYPAGSFYWHETHQHYHFDDWGTYQLWSKGDYDLWEASGRKQGQAKKVGAKTTSCVLDEEFVVKLPRTPFPGQYYGGCLPITGGQLRQVLSPGWGDTYDYWRAEQWIDLGQEKLADGQYVLRSVSDPTNKIYESPSKADTSREDQVANEGVTPFTISNGQLVDGAAPSGTVSINHVDPSTQSTTVSVDVIGRDDVSGVDQFRLSADGVTWATYPYTSGDGSVPTTVSWDLADARYGGSRVGGDRLVYAQTHDVSGKWSSTFTDAIILASAPPPTSGYGGVVAADVPVSYWRLGELSGTVAADSIGTNLGTYLRGVTLGSASLTSEAANTAAGFDGVNGAVSVPGATSLSPTGALSMETWVRPSTKPAAGGFASLVTKPEAYSLQFNGPKLEFTTIQGATRRRVQAPATAVVVGQTYHVVGTYDGGTQRLYVNGVQAASAAFSGAVNANANRLFLGSWDGASEFLAGRLDEVAVYGQVLSPAQISIHYSQGTGGTSPPTPPQRALTVSRIGTGSGSVTSSFPVGINCGTTCSTAVTDGTAVTLTATPASGSTFAGWSGGGCTGSIPCATTVTADTTVTATFNAVTPPPPPPPRPPPTSGYGGVVVADGPVSYWRLAEASGTVAADSIGTNVGTYRNGVLLGAGSLTSETANTAATFDGVNGVMSVLSSAVLSPTGALSLEAWIRPSTTPAPGGFASVVTKAEAYSLQFNGPQLEFTTIQGATRRRVQAPAGAVVVGKTYHVVGTYDGGMQRLYVNGVEVASAAFSGPVNTNTKSVALGSWDTASEFLTGTVDEVALYAKVLTPAQVASHYAQGRSA